VVWSDEGFPSGDVLTCVQLRGACVILQCCLRFGLYPISLCVCLFLQQKKFRCVAFGLASAWSTSQRHHMQHVHAQVV
jgi:hypothetical protein